MSSDGHDLGPKYVDCPKCGGDGKQPGVGSHAPMWVDCSKCGGSGTVEEKDSSHGSW